MRRLDEIKQGGRRPPRADLSWAWFFDIDGTLVEIASAPSRIVVSDDLPHIISRLRVLSGGAVSLITGRSVSDVEKFFPIDGIAVAGQHGLEMRDPSGEVEIAFTSGADFAAIRSELSDIASRHEGLIVENKGESIALHYPQAPRLAGYAHRVKRKIREAHGSDLTIQKGKRVVELKPAGANKGSAIRELMLAPPFAGRMPVFVGDDVTDEAGFRLVNSMGGHSIKVGPGKSEAKWRLRDVRDVRQWLSEAVDG
jgi:trehalose 6-phosphate phosphatase